MTGDTRMLNEVLLFDQNNNEDDDEEERLLTKEELQVAVNAANVDADTEQQSEYRWHS